MMAIVLTYLLQVSLWFIPLYLLYLGIYRKFTFFRLNRLYLIGIVLIALVMPFVRFEYIQKEILVFTPNQITENTLTPSDGIVDTEPGSVSHQPAAVLSWMQQNWTNLIFFLYVLVALVLCGRFLFSLLKIHKAILASRKHWKNNLTLVYTQKQIPHASFFRYIFLSDQNTNPEDLDKIILHEMIHYEKLHSLDVLFCELLKIVFWFNPFIYWYKQSLQEVHEFEVDAEMTKIYNEVSYAELLLEVATTQQNLPINHFSTQPLKTRLKMIFNPKTYPMKKLSFLLVIPVLAILLMAYGNIRNKKITVMQNDGKPFTILIDAGHGGKDNGAVSANNTLEKDIALKLALALKTKAEAAGFKVIMSRTDDSFIELKSRTALAVSQQVDLLVSLHVNSAKDETKNGIEFYAGKNNNPVYAEPSLRAASSIANSLQQISGIQTNAEVQARDAGIWILKGAICPSVLFEIGYLSNETDLAFISNKENQLLIADKFVEGITKFMTSKTSALPTQSQWEAAARNATQKKQYPDTLYWIKKETKPTPKNKSSKTAIENSSPAAPKQINFDLNPWMKPVKKDNC